jgi:hypothetical protein
MELERDVKEMIGALMRVLDGGEILPDEVADLEFEGDGELLMALNEAFIKLLEFVHDRDLRLKNQAYDREARVQLQECLNKIVCLCDQTAKV